MELKGQRQLAVGRDRAWEALNDPDVLKACIPGAESVERADENAYRIVLAAALGPVRAKFRGRLRLDDVVAPERYTLRFEGEGGPAGHAKGQARVTLAEAGEGTLLEYAVQAQVGGRIAQVGSRLVDAAARKLAQDFFAQFEAHVGATSHVAPGELPEGVVPFSLLDPRTWNWIAWAALLVVVVALALALLR